MVTLAILKIIPVLKTEEICFLHLIWIKLILFCIKYKYNRLFLYWISSFRTKIQWFKPFPTMSAELSIGLIKLGIQGGRKWVNASMICLFYILGNCTKTNYKNFSVQPKKSSYCLFAFYLYDLVAPSYAVWQLNQQYVTISYVSQAL